MIEQAKFTYSSLGKTFKKQTKTIEDQGRKQIDAIANQSKRLAGLTNKDDHKDIYKETFQKPVKEKFNEMKELTYEINHDDLIYYFTGDTSKKNFDNLNNGT